jgi:hypothetical protein
MLARALKDMVRRQIKTSEIQENPYVIWNAFIDLIATEDYDDVTEVQRLAHLIFWYDSEIQNGGHLQYFANSSGQRAREAENALSALGMECQQSILNEALAYISETPLIEFESADDYVSAAQDEAFEAFDRRYYDCARQANEYLEAYLDRNLEYFIELT